MQGRSRPPTGPVATSARRRESGDETLTCKLTEIAPGVEDLRDGKHLQKFRNLNVIARLEQPEDMLRVVRGAAKVREISVGLDCATLRPSRGESIAHADFRTWMVRKSIRNFHGDRRTRLARTTMSSHGWPAHSRLRTPSWMSRQSGTRFHVYPWPGARETTSRTRRRRSARPPPDGVLPVGRAAHPVGRGGRLCGVAPLRGGGGRQARPVDPNTLERTTTGSAGSLPSFARFAGMALDDCIGDRDLRARSGRRRSARPRLADGTDYPGQDELASRYARRLLERSSRVTCMPPCPRG